MKSVLIKELLGRVLSFSQMRGPTLIVALQLAKFLGGVILTEVMKSDPRFL